MHAGERHAYKLTRRAPWLAHPSTQIRRSLAWCDPRNEPNESRRLTALLVLTEAAESAPAVFNVHVKSFIDAVWFPLRDAKQHIREAAVRALKVRRAAGWMQDACWGWQGCQNMREWLQHNGRGEGHHSYACVELCFLALLDTPSVHLPQACLCLVEKRETRYRVQWYYKLHEQTMRGMKRDHRTGALPSPESIHGSLLALAELLQHTGEFMLAR